MRRLVCACVVCKPPEDRFSRVEAQLIVKKYIMVLLAQFRRDFKSYLNVGKTMAHRKQIKTTKKSTAKERTESSETEMRQRMRQKMKKKKPKSELAIQEPSTDETEPKRRKRKTKPAFLDSSSEAKTDKIGPKRRKRKLNQYVLASSSEVETEPSSEFQPGPSSEPQPGHSSEPQPGPSSAFDDKQAPDNDVYVTNASLTRRVIGSSVTHVTTGSIGNVLV